MRPRRREDAEDLAQEKLLAELEGRQFSKRDFWAKTRPSSEITSADVEVTARLYRPQITFQAESAAHRDAVLRDFLLPLLASGKIPAEIAHALTVQRVPKVFHRGKPWTRMGALVLLKRLGLYSPLAGNKRKGPSRGVTGEDRSCSNCGRGFSVKRRSNPTQFCCLSCAGKWRERSLSRKGLVRGASVKREG